MKKLALMVLLAIGLVAVDTKSCAAIDRDMHVVLVSNALLGFVLNVLPERCIDDLSAGILFLGLNGLLKKQDILAVPAYVAGKVAARVTKNVVRELRSHQAAGNRASED